jgi:hypothetical protein
MPTAYKDRAMRSQLGDWAHRSNFACIGWKFFYLDNGYVGVGPDALIYGDACCVLFGAKVPFIIRRCGSYYRLVGEYYVHVIIDGETIGMWNRNKIFGGRI